MCKHANTSGATRAFSSVLECDDFMKRVQNGDAKPVVFKDFAYKEKDAERKDMGRELVEREIWFQDPVGHKKEFQFVIMHMHFRDEFDHVRHKKRQLQHTHILAAVNLRHHKSIPTQAKNKTGHYESIFKNTYLEDKGLTFRAYNKDGWRWRIVPGKMTTDANIQCLQPEKMQGVHHAFDADGKLDPDQPSTWQTEAVNAPEDKREELLVMRVMKVIEKSMKRAACIDATDCTASDDIGVEVLAFGNNNYSWIDVPGKGILKNAIADAEAVGEAFEKIKANVRREMDIRDPPTLEDKLDEWADERLAPEVEKQVRIVIIFWAGHAFENIDGSTHLVPLGHEWKVKKLQPDKQTVSVRYIIEAVRHRSKDSRLIVILDSCRTEMDTPKWRTMQQSGTTGGPDVKSYNGVEIWFSTAHGEEARDGTSCHSPFTESILHCLQEDLQNKTFDDMWKAIMAEMQQRCPDQVTSRYTSGLCKHETLLPPPPVAVLANGPQEFKVCAYAC